MGEELSYREQDVDESLDDHDRRISRLEKAGLVALGWGLAQSGDVFQVVASLVI